MNAYTLLRLFTHFDSTKLRGPTVCHQKNPEYCIVYTGKAHTYFFAEFIRHLNVIQLDEPDLTNTNEDDKCISFEHPFDFFD